MVPIDAQSEEYADLAHQKIEFNEDIRKSLVRDNSVILHPTKQFDHPVGDETPRLGQQVTFTNQVPYVEASVDGNPYLNGRILI